MFAGRARVDDADGQGEVCALKVHPAAWGNGLGSALLTVAQTGLATAGFEHAVLRVVPGNLLARRVEQVHGVRVEEVRYRRTLPAG